LVAVACFLPGQAKDLSTSPRKVAGYIHWTICKRMGLQVTDEYDEHTPERVINFKGTTIMWDVPVTTDRTLLAN